VASANYIVAATPRTGSSLLCEGLVTTGIAGYPGEVFAPDFRGMWLKHWSLSASTGFDEYVRTAIRRGTTANGVFGLKIQWMHVAPLAGALGLSPDGDVLDLLFPNSRFINIIRQDRLAQAISWFRAIETGEWWSYKNAEEGRRRPRPLPSFNPTAVRALELDISRQQTAWEQYFLSRGQPPLIIEYEALEADYRGEVARALRFLGVDDAAARSIPEPRLARQADEITAEWRQIIEAALHRSVQA
jgi:LPS sulfotransferase NodH